MPADALSTTLAAIADPTRRAILTRLSRGEATVSELARPFDVSMPGNHQALEGAGAGRTDRTRPRAKWCPAGGAEPLKAASIWIERYREFWKGGWIGSTST